MGFRNLSLFSVALAAVSMCAAQVVEPSVNGQKISWVQYVPDTDLYIEGYVVLEDNWAVMVSYGNKEANITASSTFVLFEESPKSMFFTQVGDYPFCLMTERPLPRGRIEDAMNADPIYHEWLSDVESYVSVEGRGVRLSESEYAALSAKNSHIDFLCDGSIVNTENVKEFKFPDGEVIHIEYYLPYESLNVTIYEVPDYAKILDIDWNQMVPNSDLYTEGYALLGDTWSVMVSYGNPIANIRGSRTFALFEESPNSIFFTKIERVPFCLMTERPLPRSRLEDIFETYPTVWNSTVKANLNVEGRGVLLTKSEYAEVSAKDDRIDFLCEGSIVNTVNVTELAFPDEEPTFIEYYLPYESFKVTYYDRPIYIRDNVAFVG